MTRIVTIGEEEEGGRGRESHVFGGLARVLNVGEVDHLVCARLNIPHSHLAIDS